MGIRNLVTAIEQLLTPGPFTPPNFIIIVNTHFTIIM